MASELKEFAPWAALIFALVLTVWNSARWVGAVEAQRVWREKVDEDRAELRAKINGLPEWKAQAIQDRMALRKSIEDDHAKHRAEEAKIRDEMTGLAKVGEDRLARAVAELHAKCDGLENRAALERERLEKRLNQGMRQQIEACRERFVRLERKVD